MKMFKCGSCKTPYKIDETKIQSTQLTVNCSKCGHVMKRLLSSPGMVKTNFADKIGFKR